MQCFITRWNTASHVWYITWISATVLKSPWISSRVCWHHQNSFVCSFVWSEESRKSRRVLSAENNYTLRDLPYSFDHAKVEYNNSFIQSNSYFKNLYSSSNSRHPYSVVSMLFYFDFRPYFGYFFFARSVRFSSNVFLSSCKTSELTQPWPTSFQLPSFFLALSCTLNVNLLDTTNVFQIWLWRVSRWREPVNSSLLPLSSLFSWVNPF